MSANVYIFEREHEFSKCLSEIVEGFGIQAVILSSYEEVFQQIECGNVDMLICDLWDDEHTMSFIHKLCERRNYPCRVVFTSVFHDLSRWPELKNDYGGEYLFISKPFRSQEMIKFLFPDAKLS